MTRWKWRVRLLLRRLRIVVENIPAAILILITGAVIATGAAFILMGMWAFWTDFVPLWWNSR